MKKTAIIIIAAFMLLTISSCGMASDNDSYTGSDTSIGGLFWDILHGHRGDSGTQKTDAVTIRILNDTGADLADIAISYSQDGDVLGSCGTGHADNSPLKNGSECTFDFLPEDFPSGKITSLKLDIFARAVSEQDYTACGSVLIEKPAFGNEYELTIKYEDGCYCVLHSDDDCVDTGLSGG